MQMTNNSNITATKPMKNSSKMCHVKTIGALWHIGGILNLFIDMIKSSNYIHYTSFGVSDGDYSTAKGVGLPVSFQKKPHPLAVVLHTAQPAESNPRQAQWQQTQPITSLQSDQ